MNKRKWYHCTNENRGPVWRAGLQVPTYKSDPRVPRLCVGPSVAECFAARLFGPRDVHVYSVVCNTVKPYGVWDQVITQERWVIHRAELTLEKTIPVELVERVQCATRIWLMSGAKSVTFKIRLCQLAIAQLVLEGRVRKWLREYLAERCEIINPEDYIFGRALERVL